MDVTRDLLSYLKPGSVYRRSDLATRFKGVDRALALLVDAQALVKVWRGIYHYPKRTRYGILPPDPEKLVKELLQSDDFLIFSANDFNKLSVATTQLHNRLLVYNRKRRGRFELGGQAFEFHLKRNFPKKVKLRLPSG